MMMNEIRNKIDEHLAWCIAAIRTQHVPANPWDRAGISAAMREVQHRNPAEVFTAAYQLATNPAINTPAVLTLEGPHWTTPDPPTPATNNPRCRNCGYPATAHDHLNQGPWRDNPCTYTPPARSAQ